MTPEIERLAIQYATALVEYYEADQSYMANFKDSKHGQIFYTDRLTAKKRLDYAEAVLDYACRDQANKLASSS